MHPFAHLTKPALCLAFAAALSACGGAPASNELQFDNDGNGRFSGSAGLDWTAEEIRQQAQGLCGQGQTVTGFSVQSLSGGRVFSGQCTGGAIALAADANNVTVATTPAASVQAVQVAPTVASGTSTYVSPFATGYQPPEGFYDN